MYAKTEEVFYGATGSIRLYIPGFHVAIVDVIPQPHANFLNKSEIVGSHTDQRKSHRTAVPDSSYGPSSFYSNSTP